MGQSLIRSKRFHPENTGGIVLILVALFVVLIMTLGFGADSALSYQREKILSGQVWRIFTAPLVHLNGSHAVLNLFALFIIWGLFSETYTAIGWTVITIVCTAGIGVGLLIFDPNIAWYVGLSGMLHGYFAAGAIAVKFSNRFWNYALMILLCMKLIWEQVVGPLPGSVEISGGDVIVDAHLYGAITGLLTALLLQIWIALSGRSKNI